MFTVCENMYLNKTIVIMMMTMVTSYAPVSSKIELSGVIVTTRESSTDGGRWKEFEVDMQI